MPPPWDLVLACWRQALEPCGGCGDRADVCLEDDLRRGGGTDHRTEPAPGGWAPGGPAGIAEIVAEHKGFEPALGGLESVDGLFTGAGEVANGVVRDRGHIDGREIARLLGHAGGGDDVADRAFVRERARAPGPAGSRVLDNDQGLGLSVQLAPELVQVST